MTNDKREMAVTEAYNAVTGADDDTWHPDKTLAALNALWDRASRTVQGEPEWEYRCTGPDGDTPRRFATESEVAWHMKSGCGEVQRRKAGPWLPVTNTESEKP